MPLKAIVAVALTDELLAIVRRPVLDPATVGLNCTLRVIVWPGLKVTGKADPETEKPVPVTAAEFTVTAEVPDEARVKDCVAGIFNSTIPNDMLVASMLNVAVAAFNTSAKV